MGTSYSGPFSPGRISVSISTFASPCNVSLELATTVAKPSLRSTAFLLVGTEVLDAVLLWVVDAGDW